MNKLLQRVITAVILVGVTIVVFFRLPASAAVALLTGFVVLAAGEWAVFVGLVRWPSRALYAGVVVALMFALAAVLPNAAAVRPVLWAALAWWALAFVWIIRYPTPIRRDVGAVCGICVLVPAWLALVTLLRDGDRGPQYVLLVLATIWAADIGAYFVGRRFGQTRLAPQVSPGKTWEGFIGGLLGAAVTAGLGAIWLGLPAGFLVALSVAAAALSVVGDLTVSMFKRSAGLKDSGALFPGHGGVLDRLDSITAAAPLFFLGMGWAR